MKPATLAVLGESRRHPLARRTLPGLADARAQAWADTEGVDFQRPADTTLVDQLPGLALGELAQLVGLVEVVPLLPPGERAAALDEAVRLWRAAGLTLRALRAEAVGS